MILKSQNGNVLFIILLAVVLIAALSAAIMNDGDSNSSNIDDELLSIRVSETQRYGSELERAVRFIIQNGVSENDIRFAHVNAPSAYGDLSSDTDKSDQVFAKEGGGAAYRTPPERISEADNWEFYGGTALPSVGSDRADLIAVLPDVTRPFCTAYNESVGQDDPPPEDDGNGSASGTTDPGDCLYQATTGRFSDTVQFYASPNTPDLATFAQNPNTSAPEPALQACVKCERDGKYYIYHVLMAR